ncbi:MULTISPECIES: hypothetical protein [unclassified Sinorhizobium]|uniref:hypothetical protein n=1 Tax=unclassified Sinorhizobium TaxID=2613772 RepID=UPI003524BD25
MRTPTAILLTAILLAGCQTFTDAEKREAFAFSEKSIRAELELDRTGRIIGEPKITMEDGSPAPESLRAGVYRAIMKSQPLHLPPDKYEMWHHLIIHFDPEDLKSSA